jgi:hypothetical protein
MGARCFGECVGTAVLILLGDGVVANVLLKRSKAEGVGWLAIAAGWAFAVVFDVFTALACGSPDAYINPAFTLGMAVSSGDFSKFLAVSGGAGVGRDRRRGPGLGALRTEADARAFCNFLIAHHGPETRNQPQISPASYWAQVIECRLPEFAVR